MSLDYYRQRRTIAEPVQLDGVGLHTGESSSLDIRPADPGSGVQLTTGSLEDARRVRELSVADSSQRSTNLGFSDGREVWTVEHVLGALYGLGITDLVMVIDGPEMPAMDGSVRDLVRALDDVGTEEFDVHRTLYEVEEPVYYEAGDALLAAYPAAEPVLDVTIAHPDRALEDMVVRWEPGPDSFAEQVASARTFGFADDAEALREQGLAQGAGLENTVVYEETGLHPEQELRFSREPAWHKVLDLLGDLALTERFVAGRIVSHRGGHQLNQKLARHIRERQTPQLEPAPDEAPGGTGNDESSPRPGGSIPASRIRNILPHRYPFLLLDKILHIDNEAETAEAVKNVTINEEFFQGHFPDDPVMPGVLTLEAIAQLGGACILDRPENEGKNTYFMGVDDVKFRQPVRPGDRLLLRVEGRRIGSRSGMMDGYAYVNGELATEGLFKFMLVGEDGAP